MITVGRKYLIPASVEQAIDMAIGHRGNFKFLAGGTDVMVNRFQGNDHSTCLIDLTRIQELKGIRKEDAYLRIGALEILEELKWNTAIRTEFPMLIEAALSVGAPLLRRTATIGGNVLCENRCLYYNQSEWWRESIGFCLKCNGDICIATGGRNACFSELVSDTAPALIAMDAAIEYVDQGATTRKKLEDIFTGDGVTPRNIPDTAIVTSLWLPLNRKFRHAYFKLRERESLEFTSLTTAVALDHAGKLKIAMAGVDPRPVVIEATHQDDQPALIKKAIKKSRAIDNDMFSRAYRREMINVYLQRSFNQVMAVD